MFAAILLAQALTILVGGHPLYTNPGPIERTGRVFVPMRSIFERMGATVVYSSGNINATRGRTTVALVIGSNSANIDGRPTQLDVAPFIVGATTYVPLRFIAQSLGANVDYNNSTRVVAITMAHGGAPPYQPPPYNPAPAPPPPQAYVNLYSQQPGPNVYVNNQFATIGAQFTRAARPASVRVYLNGNDITYRAGVRANGFSYTPPAPLAPGAYRVRVTGLAVDGASFDRAWTFNVNGQAPAPINFANVQPGAGTTITNRFATISATFNRNVDASSLRVFLDGANRTNQSGVSASGFSYKPPAPLDFGSHTVRVTGRGTGGTAFDKGWSFTVRNQAPQMHLTINQPSGNAVGTTFTVQGNTVPNGRIAVTVGVPPAAQGMTSRNTTAGQAGNFSLNVTITPNPGQQSIKVRIVATDPVSGRTQEQLLQLRLR
ncbi:MAG TPA: copper amine oxidase N-terminal domain-containing protein [Candidatus Baltobacteraceae bacterium]|nr:copper amine oxidase N-terminal domain-containing protein [Candidatus Baltobacteraceae bacterium]